MKNSIFAGGMFSDLNPVYNEMCPPHQMEENLFQQHQSMAQTYSHQYNSPADHQNQQMPLGPYGVSQNGRRSYSPGMSNANEIRGMGIPSHLSTDGDRHASPGPNSLNAANKPEMQWMVTTSHIDMRSLTPPNAVVAHSGMQQSPVVARGQNPSSATISHSGYPQGNPSTSSTTEEKPRLTKSGKPRGTPGRKRKVEDHELSPEEAAKRRLRRERNKLAAAKCRNRRRELTDRLQGETDILEDHQGILTQEIMALQQEKDHLEFILASHTPICKVLQDKSINLMGGDSPKDASCINASDCIGLQERHNHSVNLVPPVDVSSDISCQDQRQASTVSVIQAAPALSSADARLMNESTFSQQNNSVIVGNENMMHGSYSAQAEYARHEVPDQDDGRFPASLANLDILDHSGPVETLNTPVCSLATPSNTSSVFTFPSTPCVTSSSLTTSVINPPDVTFNVSDFNSCNQSGTMVSRGNCLQVPYGQYSSSTSAESCSAAHRRSSSSEPHNSPDSVQSPKLLSL